MYKIGLIGSAGIGKSNVAFSISEINKIPFLKSKDITRPIIQKYGFDYKSSVCIEKFLSRKEIEQEIVEKRIYQESLLREGFITDRTTLECFAYALLSVEKYTDAELFMLEKRCKEHLSEYTHLFYFSQKNGWLEENGIRTVNTYFQWKIDLIIRGLLDDWKIPFYSIKNNELEEIIKEIESVISK